MDRATQAELEAQLVLMSRTVRDKLDRVRIKLHLAEWQALTIEERTQLRDAHCDQPQDLERFAALVDELVRRRTGHAPDRLA
ncbi:MAG TPA: nitrate reductase associated protein [Candidatus Binatia bacterium]|nr:nitrate reductase associated protein [Candidatus Binatia bacterium]